MWTPRQHTYSTLQALLCVALCGGMVLSCVGGAFHYVAHHLESHDEVACSGDEGFHLERHSDPAHHGSVDSPCLTCSSLLRTWGRQSAPMEGDHGSSAVSPTASQADPSPPLPYRPHAQRAPPVHV
jgi:hypothetical protein